MKKSLFILIAATAAVLSCNKEPNAPSGDTVHLSFTGITNDVKTSLASDFSIVWSTEDDITVFPGENAAGVTFDVSATSNNGHVATFEGDAAASASYYALSPAQVGVSISDGKISAILPTVQTAVAGSFGPEANVSVAVASDYVFQFKNVGAIVGITIGQSDITGLKLEALNGEVLSGTAVIDPADGRLVSKSGESYVQMNDNLAKDATYYFVVLPGTYAGGFRITLFKGAQYTRFSKTASYTIERNGNLDLGTYEGTNWKTAFVEGEEVVIKGSAEDGQKLAYVGADGYWNTSVTGNDVAGYSYNYEIFTRLTQNQKFYFKTAGGENYTLNAAGTAVESLAKIANAPYGAPEDGIYRIRMNFPSGTAEVKRITVVRFSQYTVSGIDMDYVSGGVWTSSNVPMKRGSQTYDNRYKFNIHFADESNQWYGRMNASGNPTYGTTADSYFYVQPSTNADSWDPGFQWPSMYENNINRYYGKVTLSMNNDGSHYTHAITDIEDTYHSANIYIQGEGAMDAGQKLAHIDATWKNTSYNGAGDRDLINGPSGYDYEIYTKLEQGKKFYFETEKGQKLALNAEGSAVVEVSDVGSIAYSGVPTTSVYRFRLNFGTGEVGAFRIDLANLKQPSVGNTSMTYSGNGTWKVDNFGIKWVKQSWNSHEDRYKFQLWFSRDLAGNQVDGNNGRWEDYAYLVNYDRPSTIDDIGTDYFYVQPWTPSDWNGCFKWPDYLCSNTDNTVAFTATITLQMNADNGKYTHTFTNVQAAQ